MEDYFKEYYQKHKEHLNQYNKNYYKRRYDKLPPITIEKRKITIYF